MQSRSPMSGAGYTVGGMDGITLEGVTLLATDVARMADFFEHVLGFEVQVRETQYVAIAGTGVRLAIFQRSGMGAHTHDHPSFGESRRGQAVELNFECATPDRVRQRYAEIVAGGAVAIAEPAERDWGHFTAFFADPEGNIHSLFAVIDREGPA